jgi:hypothetical protein
MNREEYSQKSNTPRTGGLQDLAMLLAKGELTFDAAPVDLYTL